MAQLAVELVPKARVGVEVPVALAPGGYAASPLAASAGAAELVGGGRHQMVTW